MAPQSDIHPVDRHIGLRVRELRKRLGVSQTQLAQSIGLTFQQVQKYEKGSNRISASKLVEISKSLNVPVASLFDGLPDLDQIEAGALAHPPLEVQSFIASQDGLAVAMCFPRLSKTIRRRVVALIQALASEQDATEVGETL